MEDLDYSLLHQAYSAKDRNLVGDPKIMFKILLYEYFQNIYFPRKIEKTCRRDINFMWLMVGRKAPDHGTIARFRRGLADACEDLFYQMVKRQESKKRRLYLSMTQNQAGSINTGIQPEFLQIIE